MTTIVPTTAAVIAISVRTMIRVASPAAATASAAMAKLSHPDWSPPEPPVVSTGPAAAGGGLPDAPGSIEAFGSNDSEGLAFGSNDSDAPGISDAPGEPRAARLAPGDPPAPPWQTVTVAPAVVILIPAP